MTTATGTAQSALSGLTWVGKLKGAVVDLLFPPHCVVCRRLDAWLCADCIQAVETIHPPLCHYCGLPVDYGSAAPGSEFFCPQCQRAPLQLDGLRALAFHSDPLRHAIHQFKYHDLRSLATPLGQMMAKGWERLTPPGLKLDAVVPVPLHHTRERQRGFNQAALLARELGATLRQPVVEGVLIRTRATAPQVGLDTRARHANVHDAFRCADTSLSGKAVLLVDDVCTTGSTLESACSALRKTGTSSVWAYVLARARPGPSELSVQSTTRRVGHGVDHQGQERGGDRTAAPVRGEQDWQA